MTNPSLLRYYGLSMLVLLSLIVYALASVLSRIYQLEWLGYEGFGALVLGLSFLIRGLDFLLLCRRYPSFLENNAPQWDAVAHSMCTARLLLTGTAFALGGMLFAWIGSRNLLDAIGLL